MDVTLAERHFDLVVGGFDVSRLVPFMLTLSLRRNPTSDRPTELD